MTKQEIPPWVIHEAERKKRRPKAPPKLNSTKPAEPKPKVHVKVNVSGSVEFDLEGLEATSLKGMLRRLELDNVIEFVDPWASGAELRYDVEVEDLTGPYQWDANETTGTIESREPYRPWEFR